MPGQYGGLYQNYASTGGGSNGDCISVGSTAAGASSTAGGGTTGADDSPSSSGRATPKSGLRARLLVSDRPESREKVHRIKVTANAEGEVDLRRDRPLCILGCCGRGRLMIVWSVRGILISHGRRKCIRCLWRCIPSVCITSARCMRVK
jgi:hypothetical protein